MNDALNRVPSAGRVGVAPFASSGASDSIFSDRSSVERVDDALQVSYTTRQVVSRIWRENLRPRWRLLSVALVAMLFMAATTGAVPLIIKRAADDIFNGKNKSMILYVTAAIVAVTLIKTIAEYISNVAVGYLGHRFIADLRICMFERLARADLAWLEEIHSGRLLAGFLNDANVIRNTAGRMIVALGENLFKAIALTAVMFWLDWRLSTLILVLMPVGIWLMGRQRRKMHKSTKKSMQETGDLSALITQTLRGMRIVRAYGQEEREIARARRTIDRGLEFTLRGMRARALSSPMVELLTGIGFAAAVYYAGINGLSGSLTLGDFMGFMASAMLIYQPLKALAGLQTSLQEGVSAASRVFGIIDRPSRLTEQSDAPPLVVDKGEIVFEDVTFSYGRPGLPVVDGFTFRVPPGSTVALVGPSGSGKSTILNLVLRFFDPHGGRIFIDGQDISQVSVSSLRKAVALVTQEPMLFDDTLRANIAYGQEDASEEAIRTAARAAAADDFISATASGYDTTVGEAGHALSGGERQRIAIARAFLRDAPILLLDEPTSSLDGEAEAKVQRALETLVRGRTVLMIAHRLSTVKKADLICVLDRGRVVEVGRHDELMMRGGLYARLQKTQFGEAPGAAGQAARVDENAAALAPAGDAEAAVVP